MPRVRKENAAQPIQRRTSARVAAAKAKQDDDDKPINKIKKREVVNQNIESSDTQCDNTNSKADNNADFSPSEPKKVKSDEVQEVVVQPVDGDNIDDKKGSEDFEIVQKVDLPSHKSDEVQMISKKIDETMSKNTVEDVKVDTNDVVTVSEPKNETVIPKITAEIASIENSSKESENNIDQSKVGMNGDEVNNNKVENVDSENVIATKAENTPNEINDKKEPVSKIETNGNVSIEESHNGVDAH